MLQPEECPNREGLTLSLERQPCPLLLPLTAVTHPFSKVVSYLNFADSSTQG